MNLSFKASLPRLGRVLLDAKTECSAIVAVCAEAGVGAAPGAAAAGARADAASGSTDSLGMLLTTGTHEQKSGCHAGVLVQSCEWHVVYMHDRWQWSRYRPIAWHKSHFIPGTKYSFFYYEYV